MHQGTRVVDGDHSLTEDVFDRDYPLGEGDMGELWCVHDVADGPHSLRPGAHVLVDSDETSLCHYDAGAVGEEPFGQRAAADRDHDRVDRDRLIVPERDRRPRPVGRMAVHRHPGVHGDAPLAKRACDHPHDIGVTPGQKRGEQLEHRDLAPEVTEHRGELATDRPATYDRYGRRQLIEAEDFVRAEHELPVHLEALDRARNGPRRQHHVPSGNLVGALGPAHFDPTATVQGPGPHKGRDPPAFHQARQAPVELVHDFLLASLADGEVHCRLARLHTELLGTCDGPHDAGGLEELLRRHAPAVQTGATDLVLLDHRHTQPCGRAVQSGRIPAGTTSDHDNVELGALGRHHHLRQPRPSNQTNGALNVRRLLGRHANATVEPDDLAVQVAVLRDVGHELPVLRRVAQLLRKEHRSPERFALLLAKHPL